MDSQIRITDDSAKWIVTCSWRGIQENRSCLLVVDDTITYSTQHCITERKTGRASEKLYGKSEAGDVDGELIVCRFNNPCGFAVAENNMYICDKNNYKIRRISHQEQKVSTIAGCGKRGQFDGPILQAKFYDPHSIVASNNNLLFVLDRQLLRKIENGKVSTLMRLPVDENSTLVAYPADPRFLFSHSNHHVMEIDTQTLTCTKFALELDHIQSISINTHGDFFVLSESGSCAVYRLIFDFASDPHQLKSASLIAGTPGVSVPQQTNSYFHPLIGNTSPLSLECSAMTTDLRENVYVSDGTMILKIAPLFSWRYQRILWIGKLKNESECNLSSLPREILHEIINLLVHLQKRRSSPSFTEPKKARPIKKKRKVK